MCDSKKASHPGHLSRGFFCPSVELCPTLRTRMLWVKSFHIVFVASWFAGLFYLPRIFVNLAMVAAGFGGGTRAAVADGAQAAALHHLAGRSGAGLRRCGSGWGTASAAARATAGCMPSWSWCCWPSAITTPAAVLLRRFALGRAASQPYAGTAGSTSCRCCCCSPPWCWSWSSPSESRHAQDLGLAAVASLRRADRLRQPVPVHRLARPGHRALGIPLEPAGPSTGPASTSPPTRRGYVPLGSCWR